MGDGWETARSRGKDHVDWTIIRLGAPTRVQNLLVDTAYFRGNYPQQVKLEAIQWEGSGEPGVDAEGWKALVAPSKCKADFEHEFDSLLQDAVTTHVKLVIIPDGGVKRVRVYGKRA
ncbi:Allantoicase like protein [Verticillium longisporum]|nr:Allantoicase like protein [Verticillium longisporum]